MTQEEKQKIKEEIINFYKEVFPKYPENPLVQERPEMLLEQLPRIYERLVDKKLIKTSEIPYKYFEGIAVNKFREAHIESMLSSFF